MVLVAFDHSLCPVEMNFGNLQLIRDFMDFGTIEKKLGKDGSLGYVKHEGFAADVGLVFDNAVMYYSSKVNAQEIMPGDT